MTNASNVTQLLGEWRSGDREALDRLTPLVYDELRRLARRYLKGERSDHTLQATALVNEAFIRLAGAEVPWQDRAHFFAVAARMMRRILIDHAKSRKSEKRGGGAVRETYDDLRMAGDRLPVDILDIDDALNRLARIDESKADVLVLHFFGGLTYDETAEAIGVSAATVDRHLRLGKAWLFNELGQT